MVAMASDWSFDFTPVRADRKWELSDAGPALA